MDNLYAYAAGMIDGDGCIQLTQRRNENKNYYSLRVSVSQVTERVPLWFVRNFGGRINTFAQSKINRQTIYRWSVESKKASQFLSNILPFLVEKSERAKLGIEFQSTLIYSGLADKLLPNTIEKRMNMYQQMKVLNSNNCRNSVKNPYINLKKGD